MRQHYARGSMEDPMRVCVAAFTVQMPDFSIPIEKSSHLSFLELQGNGSDFADARSRGGAGTDRHVFYGGERSRSARVRQSLQGIAER